MLLYTGGSTGHPKGVLRQSRSEEQISNYDYIDSSVYAFTPGMRTIISNPMYHGAPLYYATRVMINSGLLVLQPRFDPLEMLRLIERHRITHLFLVPTQFHRLVALPPEDKRRYDVNSLVHVTHGSAPCPVEVKRAMIEWWGPIIVELYGCTESGTVTAVSSREWMDHPGTVGRAIPGATVVAVDESGEKLESGVVGELYVRNLATPKFTYVNNEHEANSIRRGDFLTCGDLGYIDEDGYVFLRGRKKDMVISGGVNIFPAEIELLLTTMPGIVDCAVFGIPDDDWGEVLAAVVVVGPNGPREPSEVRNWLSARLGRLKVPKVIEFREFLPRDANGKMRKGVLRDPYWRSIPEARRSTMRTDERLT
jgi:long-chain acyl-CoA synthetase